MLTPSRLWLAAALAASLGACAGPSASPGHIVANNAPIARLGPVAGESADQRRARLQANACDASGFNQPVASYCAPKPIPDDVRDATAVFCPSFDRGNAANAAVLAIGGIRPGDQCPPLD